MAQQTWLVTGASRGIGLEMVRALRARGDSVIATVRSEAAAQVVGALGARVERLDVSDMQSISTLGRALAGVPIDVLCNNAGISSESKQLSTLSSADLYRVMMVNAIAPVLVSQAVLPNLRLAGGGKRAVAHISSQLGSITNNSGGSSYGYRASKAALNQFGRCMANELKGEGIAVGMIHPGWVRTDMGGPEAPLDPKQSAAMVIAVIDNLTVQTTGRFWNYDGSNLPW
ncbi:MAG: SDR family oxidoreductase [bacterium]|jgi:NAD(P)-dependent dehydrogenase (short-subunit alcohol dehydrogenase family)|nr:SDR family oxidoreductase [Phycisphaerales bacterium]MCE2654175.1 SDR family oxidoreductase [Planctomycetaceae bacterium]